MPGCVFGRWSQAGMQMAEGGKGLYRPQRPYSRVENSDNEKMKWKGARSWKVFLANVEFEFYLRKNKTIKRKLEDLKQEHGMIQFMLYNKLDCGMEDELSWKEEQKEGSLHHL